MLRFRFVISVIAAASLFATCRREVTPMPAPRDTPTSRPADSQPAATQPVVAEKPKPAEPRRPAPTWGIFREAFEDEADADLTCRWTGEKRLEVISQNVRRFTLDLNKLPPDAPQTGPWILQIDKQGIYITGRRGKVIEMVRSPNGVWSVDTDRMPGPK
ncbi:MAG: hypothetical protein DCC65_05290 [Planctomycetota bacterium]|nr:MAG: hypothetical protein DCC65_05290 [Planctomycetota bacterium]